MCQLQKRKRKSLKRTCCWKQSFESKKLTVPWETLWKYAMDVRQYQKQSKGGIVDAGTAKAHLGISQERLLWPSAQWLIIRSHNWWMFYMAFVGMLIHTTNALLPAWTELHVSNGLSKKLKTCPGSCFKDRVSSIWRVLLPYVSAHTIFAGHMPRMNCSEIRNATCVNGLVPTKSTNANFYDRRDLHQNLPVWQLFWCWAILAALLLRNIF